MPVAGGALVLCWLWEERIKVREIQPCLHLFVSVQSFNKATEGSPSFYLFPQVMPWIYRIKFLGEMGTRTPRSVGMSWNHQLESGHRIRAQCSQSVCKDSGFTSVS